MDSVGAYESTHIGQFFLSQNLERILPELHAKGIVGKRICVEFASKLRGGENAKKTKQRGQDPHIVFSLVLKLDLADLALKIPATHAGKVSAAAQKVQSDLKKDLRECAIQLKARGEAPTFLLQSLLAELVGYLREEESVTRRVVSDCFGVVEAVLVRDSDLKTLVLASQLLTTILLKQSDHPRGRGHAIEFVIAHICWVLGCGLPQDTETVRNFWIGAKVDRAEPFLCVQSASYSLQLLFATLRELVSQSSSAVVELAASVDRIEQLVLTAKIGQRHCEVLASLRRILQCSNLLAQEKIPRVCTQLFQKYPQLIEESPRTLSQLLRLASFGVGRGVLKLEVAFDESFPLLKLTHSSLASLTRRKFDWVSQGARKTPSLGLATLCLDEQVLPEARDRCQFVEAALPLVEAAMNLNLCSLEQTKSLSTLKGIASVISNEPKVWNRFPPAFQERLLLHVREMHRWFNKRGLDVQAARLGLLLQSAGEENFATDEQLEKRDCRERQLTEETTRQGRSGRLSFFDLCAEAEAGGEVVPPLLTFERANPFTDAVEEEINFTKN